MYGLTPVGIKSSEAIFRLNVRRICICGNINMEQNRVGILGFVP